MAGIPTRYIEFSMNRKDTHPQTGANKNVTVMDMYVFADHVELWGWGTIDMLRPRPGMSPDAMVERIKDFMTCEGFAVLTDEAIGTDNLLKDCGEEMEP